MKLYLALIVFFAIGLFIAPNVFADSTRTQNFDGINGWSCYTDGVFSCNGPNKYPITVKQSDTEGRPTPSLLVSGDPPTNTHACAEKFITSDWDIESVEISLDVYGHITPRNHPVVEIGVDKYDISGPSFEWISFEKTQNVNPAQKNSIPIRLCITDSNKATEPRAAYFDNIIIKTNEINPDWIAEEEAKRDAEEKAAAEAEKAKQAAEAEQKAAAEAAAAAAEQQRIAEEKATAAEAARIAAEEKAKADAAAAQSELQRNELEKNEILVNEGVDLLMLGKYTEALNIFDNVISSDPVNYPAYYGKGYAFYQLEMYVEALENFNKALSIFPDDSMILLNIGISHYQLQNYSESLDYFKSSLVSDPLNGEAQLWINYVESELGNLEAIAAEEAARIAAEQAAAEEAARIAAADAAEQQRIAEQAAAEEAARIAAEQAAAEQAARIAAEQEAARIAAEQEAERQRIAAEQEAERQRIAAEQAAADAAEAAAQQAAAEEAARIAAEQAAAEAAARAAAEQVAAEAADAAEAARIAAEQAIATNSTSSDQQTASDTDDAIAAAEAARIAAEQAAADAASSIAAEQAAAQQAAAQQAAAQQAAAQQAAAEAARIAAEQAAEQAAADIPVYVDPTIVPPPPPVTPVDVTPDNTEIFDTPSNSVQVETSNNDFIFTKTWKNDNQFGSQQFAYILQIKDENDVVVSISYVSGMLGPKQTFEQSLSFDPGSHGSYLATAYVWDDLINQNVLDNPESVLIQVTPEKTSNLSSTDDWLEDFMP